MNKQAVWVLYVYLLNSYELIVSYGPPKPSFGRSPFFFSGLMTGPTYRPLVRHSNADTPLILSILDFQVGARIEYSRWEIFEDTEVSKILALPDVAHLVCVSCNIQQHLIYIYSAEDYSYLPHQAWTSPNNCILHFIGSKHIVSSSFLMCSNQQIPASSVLVKGSD